MENLSRQLLGSDTENAFNRGAVRYLLEARNRFLGSLISSDRSLYYCTILYRMLLFRREHELEPLHEDLYRAVRSAQEALDNRTYGADQFLIDMNQLVSWNLATQRIEKERIRGYKDSRRTKFRYGLTKDTIRLLVWLEERLSEDIEDRVADARDLLEDATGTLHELVRLLRTTARRSPDEQEARRILYQAFRLQGTTQEIALALTDFNAVLLSFLLRDYDIKELKDLLDSLQQYVDKYLDRIAHLRENMLPDLRRLKTKGYHDRLMTAHAIMENEKRALPGQLHSRGESAGPSEVPQLLNAFYSDDGTLDTMCHRINDAALKIWKRMSTHLKELDRRSHRIENIRDRINDLSAYDQYYVPSFWLKGMLGWAHFRADMHYWDDTTLADPPRPKRGSVSRQSSPIVYISRKEAGAKPVQSMEQARLAQLKEWIERMAPELLAQTVWDLTKGNYSGYEDLAKVIELARSGLLGSGKKLRSIGLQASISGDSITLTGGTMQLACRNMQVTNFSS